MEQPQNMINNQENRIPEEFVSPKKEGGKVGPFISSIIIIIIIILGGLYFWGAIIDSRVTPDVPEDVSEIEEELNIDAELEELDSDLADIEAEIDAALSE